MYVVVVSGERVMYIYAQMMFVVKQNLKIDIGWMTLLAQFPHV